MALWRDPLDELIADLERALPSDAQPGRYEVLPRLEDLQAVATVILFAPAEEQRRMFADPQYQCLYDTVMKQLQRPDGGQRDDCRIEALPIDLVD